MGSIGAELLDPFPQYILMNARSRAACAADTPRSLTSLTALSHNRRRRPNQKGDNQQREFL
jgi:hypothetical protein